MLTSLALEMYLRQIATHGQVIVSCNYTHTKLLSIMDLNVACSYAHLMTPVHVTLVYAIFILITVFKLY